MADSSSTSPGDNDIQLDLRTKLALAAMAIGAALIWPAVVGLTFSLVPAARIGIAGGLLLGVSGVGNALGPIVGGFLTDEVSWRAIPG